MLKGGAIYYDMEQYTTTASACRSAVLRFLSAWTSELHRLGYVSGVYENLNLGARDLAGVYNSAAYARPDALWIARYDLDPALTGWAGIADNLWAVHQRAKQYQADFTASYGGVRLAIDADNLDAPVATTAFTYQATAAVRARSGQGRSYPLVKMDPKGSQPRGGVPGAGSAVGTSTVWDKLNDGSYVTDYYVSTPSKTGYSAPVTRCLYPYQVTPGQRGEGAERARRLLPGHRRAARVARSHGCSASKPARRSAAPRSGTRSTAGTGSPTTGSRRRAPPATASPHRVADAQSAGVSACLFG